MLELVNPNAGPAIADITVRSPNGVVDVPALRGVSVPGNSSMQLDLGQIVPNRAELSLEVHTSRGRLAAHVVDSYDQLGSGATGQDWLPAQAEPATANLLLGLTKGAGERTLRARQPGRRRGAGHDHGGDADLHVRADRRRAGPGAPRLHRGSLPGRRARPRRPRTAPSGCSSSRTVRSPPPLRQFVGADLSLLTAAPAVDAATAVVVPVGPKHLLLAGADAAGGATVTSYSARGKQLDQQEVEVGPDAGADLALPDDAVLVTVTPRAPRCGPRCCSTGTGTAVVPLRELVLTGLVPDVRPGVP